MGFYVHSIGYISCIREVLLLIIPHRHKPAKNLGLHRKNQRKNQNAIKQIIIFEMTYSDYNNAYPRKNAVLTSLSICISVG
jgi:hypothetical protein